MDVSWVMHPGQDPAKLLAQYPHRWALMHLKDLRRGASTGIHTGHAPSSDDVPLGTGQVKGTEGGESAGAWTAPAPGTGSSGTLPQEQGIPATNGDRDASPASAGAGVGLQLQK